MIEYHVRIVENGSEAELSKVCNELAKDRWRLVSTSAATTVGIAMRVRVYLFFEREMEASDRLEEAVATMDAGERRELMDVAVAQAEGETVQ